MQEVLIGSQTYESLSITIINGLIICPCCNEMHEEISFKRRYTSYINIDMNYLMACEQCHNDDHDYFDELWAGIGYCR